MSWLENIMFGEYVTRCFRKIGFVLSCFCEWFFLCRRLNFVFCARAKKKVRLEKRIILFKSYCFSFCLFNICIANMAPFVLGLIDLFLLSYLNDTAMLGKIRCSNVACLVYFYFDDLSLEIDIVVILDEK